MRNTPRDHQLVSKGEKRLLVSEGEGADARERSEHHAVGGHSPEPVGRKQPGMLGIEGPFVETHLDEATAQQHPNHDEEAQAVDLTQRQRELITATLQEQVHLQEPEGVADAVPP